MKGKRKLWKLADVTSAIINCAMLRAALRKMPLNIDAYLLDVKKEHCAQQGFMLLN